jgi:hypothetical protein
MHATIVEAAGLLGAKLTFLREESWHSNLLGQMRTLVFSDSLDRLVDVTPSEHSTVFLAADQNGVRRSTFSIMGPIPTTPTELAAYLEKEPRLIDLITGGALSDMPIDWGDYR